MRSGRRLVAAMLLPALLAPAPLPAATPPPSDWARVRAQKPGHKLAVHLHDGATHKGDFVSADEDAITLRIEKAPVVLARADVRVVRHARRSAGRKIAGFFVGALLGAFGGLFLGGAIGAGGCQDYCEDAGLIGASIGFLFGAVLGGLFGLGLAAQGEGAVVYAAP
jgi:hypothetical protein